MPSKSSLEAFFKDNRRVAIGYSGGVDSSFLVHFAAAERAEALPVFIKTPFIRESEQEDAESFCERRGIKMVVADIDLYSDERVVGNGPDRCYFCKRAMFEKVWEIARENGCDVVADGTNASDPVDDRPGVRALRELGVRSPLRDADLSKSAIRRISRMDRLETWNKQSNSCLATRIDSGVRITPELVAKVADSEDALAALDFFIPDAAHHAVHGILRAKRAFFERCSQHVQRAAALGHLDRTFAPHIEQACIPAAHGHLDTLALLGAGKTLPLVALGTTGTDGLLDLAAHEKAHTGKSPAELGRKAPLQGLELPHGVIGHVGRQQ